MVAPPYLKWSKTSVRDKVKSVKCSTCGSPLFSVCKSHQGCTLEELAEEEALILLDSNQHHFHKPQLHPWNRIQSFTAIFCIFVWIDHDIHLDREALIRMGSADSNKLTMIWNETLRESNCPVRFWGTSSHYLRRYYKFTLLKRIWRDQDPWRRKH